MHVFAQLHSIFFFFILFFFQFRLEVCCFTLAQQLPCAFCLPRIITQNQFILLMKSYALLTLLVQYFFQKMSLKWLSSCVGHMSVAVVVVVVVVVVLFFFVF